MSTFKWNITAHRNVGPQWGSLKNRERFRSIREKERWLRNLYKIELGQPLPEEIRTKLDSWIVENYKIERLNTDGRKFKMDPKDWYWSLRNID